MYSENQCLNFAMWFAENWEFHDSTLQGEMYISKKGNEISSVDDIFYKFFND